MFDTEPVISRDGAVGASLSPNAPPLPRLWTLALAYSLLWSAALGVGFVLAFVALFTEIDHPVELLRDPEAFASSTQEFFSKPWVLLFSVSATAALGGTIAVAAATMSPQPLTERLRLVPLTGTGRLKLGATVAAVLAVLGVSEAMSALAAPFASKEYSQLGQMSETIRAADPASWVGLLLAAGLAAPIAEELFFRGYLQTRLVHRIGRWSGIGLTALLFGLLHMDPVHTPVAFGIGMMLGWAADRLGSVRPAIWAHVVNNLLYLASTRWLPWEPGLVGRMVSLAIAATVAGIGILWLRRLMRAQNTAQHRTPIGP